MNIEEFTFGYYWSEDEHIYVGVCQEFPLEWRAVDPDEALFGVRDLVIKVLRDFPGGENVVCASD